MIFYLFVEIDKCKIDKIGAVKFYFYTCDFTKSLYNKCDKHFRQKIRKISKNYLFSENLVNLKNVKIS